MVCYVVHRCLGTCAFPLRLRSEWTDVLVFQQTDGITKVFHVRLEVNSVETELIAEKEEILLVGCNGWGKGRGR